MTPFKSSGIMVFVKTFVKQYTPVFIYKHLQAISDHFYISSHRKLFEQTCSALILSFPKSGRTWLRYFLGKYYSLLYSVPVNIFLHEEIHPKAPRILFSHDRSLLHLLKGRKLVILLRDPRDTIVSYYYQCTKRQPIFKGNISSFIKDPVLGILPTIHFMNRLYEDSKNHKGTLVVYYEDFRKSPKTTFPKLLRFLDIPLKQKIVLEALAFSDFKNMHKMEKGGGFAAKQLQAIDKKKKSTYKVRKGKIGGYKDELSKKDVTYLENCVRDHLHQALKKKYKV